MASGSAGLANNSGSRGFNFASDDILCSYQDYTNPDNSTRSYSDPAIGSNSMKEFPKNRMTRSSMLPAPAYSQPEDSSFHQDVIDTVEKSMKKHTDNLMRFLEGISSRLSQLELYCYNLDKSIGEIRSDLVHDHEVADSKLKSFENHLHEVHRSIQILRDKQELSEAQEELAKLQFAQKESVSASNSQQDEQRTAQPASETKRSDNSSELALVLPHQVQSVPPVPQSQGYYLPPAPNQLLLGQYMSSDSQYRAPQTPKLSRPPQPVLPYQQQWLPQLPQQTQQPLARPSSSDVYPPYPSSQPSTTPEVVPNNISMQVPFSGNSQTVASRPEGMPYGSSPALGAHGDGYGVNRPRPSLAPGISYAMYDNEGARGHHHPPQQPPAFPQTAYLPPSGFPPQHTQPGANTNVMAHPPQVMRNRSHNKLVEKLVSMGYRGDHVINAIQRLEESGQAVDFNTVLDRLNGHSSGGSRKGW